MSLGWCANYFLEMLAKASLLLVVTSTLNYALESFILTYSDTGLSSKGGSTMEAAIPWFIILWDIFINTGSVFRNTKDWVPSQLKLWTKIQMVIGKWEKIFRAANPKSQPASIPLGPSV